LYVPDSEGNEVKLDEGADVIDVTVSESDDSDVDAVDVSAVVSVGRASSLDGNAAMVAAVSTIEEVSVPVGLTPGLPGSTAVSGKYVLTSTVAPDPSTTWTTDTV
jgi:hypothetical protein